MDSVGTRLRMLRRQAGLSQTALGQMIGGLSQSAMNRYESGRAEAPYKTLLWYADYFDVSMDYIFGRTDQRKPEPPAPPVQFAPDMDEFVEACFEPGSPLNHRLKEMLLQMMRENQPGKEAQP